MLAALAAATAAHNAAIAAAGLDPLEARTHAWWAAYEAAYAALPELRRAEDDWFAACVADTLDRHNRRRPRWT